jgi:hypothetical protein
LERAKTVMAGVRPGQDSSWFDRHWRLLVLVFWLAAVALLVKERWLPIQWFGLGDTDDNLRMMQVRGLLAGQEWFDLRQYRLDPPYGANVHWSRIVDLPIAGMMLVLRLFMSGAMAEKIAVAAAPLLPMLVTMGAIGALTRRMVGGNAVAVGLGLLLCAHSVRGMWAPLRIDHHGWQLAALSLAMLALTDRRPARGGLMLGLATSFSLSIGLEMLLYLAAAGAAAALMWVRDEEQAPRLAAYGASLAAGCGLGFLLFASNDNRLPVCDALSPVWLSTFAAAGAAGVLLSRLQGGTWAKRLLFGAAAGIALAAIYALSWPHCLGRLEGSTPELEEMWLSRVREAQPIYKHSWLVMAAVLSLPLAGIIGYGLMLRRNRRDAAAMIRWAALFFPALIAAALLLWQTRAGPAAQLLAIPGAAALAWWLIMKVQERPQMLVRVLGSVLAFYVVSGFAVQNAVQLIPEKPRKNQQVVNNANGRCPTLYSLRPIARQPRGYVFTHVDLGPRLITVTHHDAIAGPYHRNQQAILDVMRGFRGTPEAAHAMVRRRGVDYVLICPGLSETTVYSSAAPKGFYAQLARGQVPAWLTPVTLPKDSPYRMWRVVKAGSRTPS